MSVSSFKDVSLVIGAFVVCLIASATPVFAAEPLPILPRSDWGAKPPSMAMTAQVPSHVTFHHSAARQRLAASTASKMLSLQRFSQSSEKLADGRTKKPWADVPYHFYIAADGSVAEGRDVSFSGDTNTDYDPKGHIAIVLEGNFENELPAEAQIDAAIRLGQLMMAAYQIEPANLGFHQHHASTACPGANFVEIWPLVRQRILAAEG
ncbi:MAG: N-acetylmuramoyl-L-alanine amidase [Rhodobacteraceae bacterium]|nr:N-acetylmuramoyl-L-alanine amidase [Paracoccaceae bacterium]